MSWYYIEGILIQSCYTLLIVLGLSILTCLDGDHILTTIISGLIGLLLACVGQDKMYAGSA